jgi:hypothetical protein
MTASERQRRERERNGREKRALQAIRDLVRGYISRTTRAINACDMDELKDIAEHLESHVNLLCDWSSLDRFHGDYMAKAAISEILMAADRYGLRKICLPYCRSCGAVFENDGENFCSECT